MAPPTTRRYGHSKRAQYSAFTGYVIAGLGALLGAGLLIISLFQPAAFSDLRGIASDVAAPVGKPGAVARAESKNWFDEIAAYFDAASKNAALQREVEAAKVKLAEADAIKAENRRLKGLLDIQETEQVPVATARLVGATNASVRRFAYLPVGSGNGIGQGMPVVAPDGLVGRILETGRSSSRVLLLNDPESLVPVRRVGDDIVAFAEGRPDGNISIKLVNLGINPLKVGDVFVTSGAGGLFRPGLPVAVAMEITRDGAIANMLSNPAATDYVAIEPVWNPEMRQAADSDVLDGAAAEQPTAEPAAE